MRKSDKSPQTSKRALIAMLGLGVGLGAVDKALARAHPAGGDAAFVADLATLAALNPSVATAILTQTGLFGLFTWVSGTFTAQIANDPGHGVYVAWSGDSAPGATGAWVRQYSGAASLSWFGAVGNGALTIPVPFGPPTITGGADNSTALNNFATWARAQTAAGIPVIVQVEPGNYLFDHSKCQGFLQNIHYLRWYNNGALWQNTYNPAVHGSNFKLSCPWGFISQPLFNQSSSPQNWFIRQTVVGSFSFTFVTPAEAANIRVGDWVMLASLDIEYFGYPPNAQQFEFVHVSGVNASTGVVTIEQAIRYEHRTDFPDAATLTGVLAIGVARVWATRTGPWTYGSTTLSTVIWDVDHEYHDLYLGAPLGETSHLSQPYWTISGRKIKTVNYKGVGLSESMCAQVIHEDPQELMTGETDKLVESIELSGLDYYNGLGAPTQMVFPSGSLDRVLLRNCKVGYTLNAGNAKNLHAINCDIGNLIKQGGPGFGNQAIFENCRIYNSRYACTLLDGLGPKTIDGANVRFANGVLTFLKYDGSSGLNGKELSSWGMIPGQTINLLGPGGIFTGAAGNGVVLRLHEDAANVHIVTTLPYATLPPWSNNQVWIFKDAGYKMIRCTGTDRVRSASCAYEKGLEFWEYKRYTFGGAFSASAGFVSEIAGNLAQVTATPIQLGNNSSAHISLTFTTYDAGSNFAADRGGTVITIYVGLAGQRVITQSSFSGAAGGDGVTVGGVSSSYLPTNRVVGGNWTFHASNYTANNYQAPMFVIELQFDCGIARKLVPVGFDNSGSNNRVFAATGLLP